jgi:hypothetical protein
MSLPRSRIFRQSPGASPAVHTIHNCCAEPKRSTPFTYLQVHAQVVHYSLSRRSSPPASLGLFQRSSGLAQVAGKCRHHPRALAAPSVQRRHPAVFVSVRSKYLGKNHIHPASRSTPVQMQCQPLSFILDQDRVPHCYPSRFGKSQGYSFRQNLCQRISFLRQPFPVNHQEAVVCEQNILLKANVSPNFRLVQ